MKKIEKSKPVHAFKPAYFYSASSGCFYISGVHPEMPKDVVEVSKEEHEALIAQVTPDTHIGVDDKGKPCICDNAPMTRSQYDATVNGTLSAHFDVQAQDLGYSNAATLVSYSTSSVKAYKSEAEKFIAWRDTVCVAAYDKLDQIPESERPIIETLIASLPKFEKA